MCKRHVVAEASFHIGADENGLGPRLGPMVVTAVLAKVAPGAEKIIGKKPRGKLAERLGDSKGLVAHGDCALAEAWARVLAARGAGRHADATTPDRLLDAVSLDERGELTSLCPEHVATQCWRTDGEGFASGEEIAAMMRDVARDLDRLARRGIEVVAVRSIVVCNKRLNAAVDEGKSRFVVDLHTMERLVLAMRDMAGQQVTAVCGKVGGFGQYGKVFGPLGGRLHAIIEESRSKSAYRFPGIGDIAFVMDGDASNILVGMASLVGKYVRELMMSRIVHHYRSEDASLPIVSGYHDPITSSFIVATQALRKRQRVPKDCFEREKLGTAE
jgi:ribonuclease HII